MTKSKFSLALVSAAAALALTACGGGGDSPAATAAAPAPSPAPTAPGPTAAAPSPAPTTPSPAVPVAAQASDKYVGTWQSACESQSEVRQGSSSGAFVRQRGTFVFTATGSGQLSLTARRIFFAPADTNCSQPSIGNLATNNNTLTIDGTTVIGGQTLEKVTVTSVAAFPGLTGGAGGITVNGLNYPNSINTPQTDKALLLVTATKIISGDGPVDASGYSTTFDINDPNFLTKQ